MAVAQLPDLNFRPARTHAILRQAGAYPASSTQKIESTEMQAIRSLKVVRFLLLCMCLIRMVNTTTADDRKLESGDKALPFKATDLEGKSFEFQPDKTGRWTVLVFLRGYPGYQCPLCSRQVGELLAKTEELAAARTNVVFVYPGVAKDLTAKSKEFLVDKQLPSGFNMVIDQDYEVVNAYHLRWQAPRETAYPSTFVIDPTGVIRYAKISQTHGDRAPVKEVLAALGKP